MNDKIKKVPSAVVGRLPRYLRYIRELMDNGETRVSSSDLSVKMNLTASQVRQDFNSFGGFGQQGYGYRINKLYGGLKEILGLNLKYHLIVLGCGNLGQALINYQGFEDLGFYISAAFDINPKIIGMSIRGIEVYDIDRVGEYISKNKVDVAILTLPRNQAAKEADMLVGCGIKGIWNFAPIDLEMPNDVAVENVHLTDSLMTLIYRLNELRHLENYYKAI